VRARRCAKGRVGFFGATWRQVARSGPCVALHSLDGSPFTVAMVLVVCFLRVEERPNTCLAMMEEEVAALSVIEVEIGGSKRDYLGSVSGRRRVRACASGRA
jgi:hypothetical protein